MSRKPWTEIVDILAKLAAIAAALIALIGILVLPVNGTDHFVHLYWIGGFIHQIDLGHLIPRWLPDSLNGFGAPSFYFYPPFTFYLTAVLHLLFGISDPTLLYRLVSLLAFLGSIASCYAFLRYFAAPRDRAFFGALIYTFAPFRLFELFHHSAFSAHLAFALLPLGLLFIVKLLKEKILAKNFLIAVCTWVAIFLTSIPNVEVALVALCLILVVRWRSSDRRRRAVAITAVIGALCVTAYYYFPIPHLQTFTQSASLWPGEFRIHFLYSWMFDLRHGRNVTQGIQNLLALILEVVCLWEFRSWWFVEDSASFKRESYALFAIVFLLQIPIVHGLAWQYIPLFKIVQFEFRWNILLCLAFAYAWACQRVGSKSRLPGLSAAIWMGVAAFSMIVPFTGYRLHVEDWSHTVPESPAYASVYSPAPTEWKLHDLLARHTHDPDAITEFPFDSSNVTTKEIPSGILVSTKLSRSQRVVLHQWYWPYFALQSGTENVQLFPDSIGRVTAVLPAGSHTFLYSVRKSPEERIGDAISYFGLCFVVAFTLWILRFRNHEKSKDNSLLL